MKVEEFIRIIDADFYAGVPDSQLKEFCDYLIERYGIDSKYHVITANEGNAVALAAGYYLATEKVPVVYMQNSGEGNIINPVASLSNKKVYGIPMVFVIGWRGEPGVPDEPQHIYQGEITNELLELMQIDYFVIDRSTTEIELEAVMERFRTVLHKGENVAFVVRKGTFSYEAKSRYENSFSIVREEAIRLIAKVAEQDPVISTTGKASRELFEIRESNGQGHSYDFLTVGAMGHSSSIALGIALQKPNTKVWCIDGDGAVLMHMGSMAVLGANSPENLVHILLNNQAHDTVGGMPNVSEKIDYVSIARACGYKKAVCVEDISALENILMEARESNVLCFIEVKCKIGARIDLGRPSTSPQENKNAFMQHLKQKW